MKKNAFLFAVFSIGLSVLISSCSSGKHEHSYEETIIKEATCQTVGKVEKKCSCGDVIEETIPVSDHECQLFTIPATCIEKGTKYNKCVNCGSIIDMKDIDYANHTYIEESTIAATCSKGKIHNMVCKVCGVTTIIQEDEVDENAHSYTKETVAATCTEEGYDLFTCSLCGDEKKENVQDKTSHSIVSHEGKAPSCTEDGWAAYETCSNCDYSTYEVVSKLGHSPKDKVEENVVPSTCTENGSHDEVVYCANCEIELSRKNVEDPLVNHSTHETIVSATCESQGYTLIECENCSYYNMKDVTLSLGHNIVQYEKKDPTCTEIGYDAYEACSRCDYTTYSEKAALEHDKVQHEAQAVSCLEIGWDAYETCSRCDYTTYEEIAALGHNTTQYEAKAVTCTEIGYDAYIVCNRCGYSTYSEIEALGHSPKAAVKENVVSVTCTVNGSHDEVVYCATCNEELSRENKIDTATGHQTSSSTVYATCTTGGYTLITCSKCTYSSKTNQTSSLGHNYVNYSAQAATCTEIGWNSYKTCSRCNDSTFAMIPAKGHTESNCVYENVVNATCETAGHYDKVVYCKDCNLELSRENINVNAYGHNMNSSVTNPTCTEKGYTTHTCSRCSKSYKDTYTDMVDHTIVEIPATYNTCGAVDYSAGQKCSVCKTILVAQNHLDKHNWSYTQVIEDATCSNEGRLYCECDACFIDGVVEFIPAEGHFGVICDDYTPATCTSVGYYDYTCTKCGEPIFMEIPMINHSIITVNGKAATCSESGLTDGQKCRTCSMVVTPQETIPATGIHTPINVDGLAPTCTKAGYTASSKCSVCGEVLQEPEVLKATGHKYNDERECINCDYKDYVEKYNIAASGKVIAYLLKNGATYYELLITGNGKMKDFGTVTDSNKYPWYSYTSKINKLTISEEVTSIGGLAFKTLNIIGYLDIYFNAIDCKKNKSIIWGYTEGQSVRIHIGSKVKVINDYFFSAYYGGIGYTDQSQNLFVRDIEFLGESSCTTIGKGAFADITQSETYYFDITIPKSVKTIGESAFRNSGIRNVTIGIGVTFIGKNAFTFPYRKSNCTINLLSKEKWRRSTSSTASGDYIDLYNNPSQLKGSSYNWFRG